MTAATCERPLSAADAQVAFGSSGRGTADDDGGLFTSRSYSRSMSGLDSMKSALARLQAIGTL
jgi:hypothetical protein